MLQGLRFTITDPQEGPAEYTVDSDRALVGSAPHCEIRLAPEQMDPEQLRDTTMHRDTRRLVQLTVSGSDKTDQLVDMLLAKKRSQDRRKWLETKGDLAEV